MNRHKFFKYFVPIRNPWNPSASCRVNNLTGFHTTIIKGVTEEVKAHNSQSFWENEGPKKLRFEDNLLKLLGGIQLFLTT